MLGFQIYYTWPCLFLQGLMGNYDVIAWLDVFGMQLLHESRDVKVFLTFITHIQDLWPRNDIMNYCKVNMAMPRGF